MFSKEMIHLINEIKKEDPNFSLTEEEIEECKKEDPNFSLTEEDLRETLAYKKCIKEMLKEVKLDRNDYHGLVEI